MLEVIRFIREHFSIYTVLLILVSSYMLLFVDRKQLKCAGLKKESSFSNAAGIVYLIIAAAAMIIGIYLPF